MGKMVVLQVKLWTWWRKMGTKKGRRLKQLSAKGWSAIASGSGQ